MNKPSARQAILFRSIQRLLEPDEKVHAAVVLSTRHRLFFPYVLASGLLLFVVAVGTGVTDPATRIALAIAGAGVASMATTNYSILAETSAGLVLCRSSRVRQYAKSIVRRLARDASLEMVGSTVITSDWRVDGVIYTLTKRWEATMRQLSTERS